MKARTIVLSFALIAMICAGPIDAQVRDETILTYQVLTENWHDLIAGVLDLTDAEAEAFWPVYEEYAAAKGALWNERIDVIKMFLAGYNTMGPEVARGLLDASFEIQSKMIELEKAYAQRFDDILPPAKVVRLFQAENKLETMMSMEIVKDIPLAKK